MTRKLLFSFVALCLSSLITLAQPKIDFRDTLDFGDVVPKQELNKQASVSGTVLIRNLGDSMLIISDLHPSCGCTTPKMDVDTIAPGAQGTMHVGLNLPVINGEILKSVSITSNDPSRKVSVLHVRANVQRPVQLSSSFIPFNKGRVGDSIMGTLTMSAYGTDPITFETEVHNSKLVLGSPAKQTLKPGESMNLVVYYVPDKEGVFSVQVLVKTSAPGYESFDLRGYGTVDPKPANK